VLLAATDSALFHKAISGAVALLSGAGAQMWKHNRHRIRKLERDVSVLQMDVYIHKRLLEAHGFMVPPVDQSKH